MQGPRARLRAEQRPRELRRVRPLVVLVVCDAQPPAEIDDRRRPVELGAGAGREGGEPIHGCERRGRVEELRPDVDVQAGDIEPTGARVVDDRERMLGREAELRPPMRRADRLVRVGVDSGRHAEKHVADSGGRRALGLVGRVEDDQRCLGCGGCLKLLVALVVSVHHDPVRRDIGGEREAQLTERRDVGAETFLDEHAEQRDVRERLRSEDDQRVGRGAGVRAGARAKGRFAEDDERRAELVRKRRRASAADGELARLDGDGLREERERRRRGHVRIVHAVGRRVSCGGNVTLS